MSQALLRLELLILLLQKIISLTCLSKLLINKLILLGQCLNILCQLIALLGLHLNNLQLRLNLVPLGLVLLPEQPDLVLSFVQSPLEIIFLARDFCDVMLHVAVFENLLFHFLFGGCQLLSLTI